MTHDRDQCECLCHLATPEVDCFKCNPPANCEDEFDPGDIGEGGWQPDVDAPSQCTDRRSLDVCTDDLPAQCQQCSQPIDPRFSFCGDRCSGIKFLEPQPMVENLLIEAGDALHLLHRQYCQHKRPHSTCPATIITRQIMALLYPHRI